VVDRAAAGGRARRTAPGRGLTPTAPARVASVFGSARLREDDAEYAVARRLGALLGGRGWTVCTGGYDGAMAAVSRGAHEAGGHVVGVTMSDWDGRLAPNAWLAEVRPAEDLFARLRALLLTDAWLAVAGGIGTLAEVAVAWNLLQMGGVPRRPLILLGRPWRAMLEVVRDELVVGPHDLELVRVADTPEDAVALLP
jgi:uncharacterized protein (TIGR00730 family)